MYNILQYGLMMQDAVRVNSHYQALKETIRPGDVVVDLGAGTGIFSLMACQLGAKYVYAIESNLWGELGKQMAIANGFADRIEFFNSLSTEVTLPEQGDILIGDLRAASPIIATNVDAFMDARKRFLKPDGIIIPRRDVVYVSLVNLPDTYRTHLTQPWLNNPYELNMEVGYKFAANYVHGINRTDIQPPLFPPKIWAEIDYMTLESHNLSATLEWEARDTFTAHAIFTWFRAHLTDEVSFTNSPWETRASAYGNMVMFLEKPLEIVSGDNVMLELKAVKVQKDYIYIWNTTLRSKSGEIKSQFQQSSFLGMLPTSRAFESQKKARPES